MFLQCNTCLWWIEHDINLNMVVIHLLIIRFANCMWHCDCLVFVFFFIFFLNCACYEFRMNRTFFSRVILLSSSHLRVSHVTQNIYLQKYVNRQWQFTTRHRIQLIIRALVSGLLCGPQYIEFVRQSNAYTMR